MTKTANNQDYFVRSALKEISLLREHFHIKGQGDDVNVAGEISPLDIKKFFKEYFAFVRPANLSEDKIRPKIDTTKIRAWYLGQPDINLILNLVIRHCLYVDQIVIVDPFIILPHADVINQPQVWAETLINRALCLCALEDWIAQEIVLIIPSVFHYHPELEEAMAQNPSAYMPKMTKQQYKELEHKFIVDLLVDEPLAQRASLLDLIEAMGRELGDNERENLLAEAAEYENAYPIRFRLSSEYYTKHFKGSQEISQVFASTLSSPMSYAPILAEQMGAFLIFEYRLLYDIITENYYKKDVVENPFQKIAIAFQNVDFPFLHNVSLKDALKIRKKGYLHRFRVYLRDLWTSVSEHPDTNLNDAQILEFSDRLKSEYSILEEEWNNIRQELRIKAITSGLTVGLSAGTAIAFGNINWTIGAVAGTSFGLLKEQFSGYVGSTDKLNATHKNPLSIFLMLKH
jgi:hypothetical protein